MTTGTTGETDALRTIALDALFDSAKWKASCGPLPRNVDLATAVDADLDDIIAWVYDKTEAGMPRLLREHIETARANARAVRP